MDRIAAAEQHRRRQAKSPEVFRGSSARLFRAAREGADLLTSLRFLARDRQVRAHAELGAAVLGRGRSQPIG